MVSPGCQSMNVFYLDSTLGQKIIFVHKVKKINEIDLPKNAHIRKQIICQKMLTFYLKTWFSKKCSHYNLIRLILPKNAHNQFWIHSILPKNAHNWIWIYIIFKNMLYVIFFPRNFKYFKKCEVLSFNKIEF